MMYVKFWGVRGSIPTPDHSSRIFGGNTSCVEIRTDEAVFILDAGTGIPAAWLRSHDPWCARPLNQFLL